MNLSSAARISRSFLAALGLLILAACQLLPQAAPPAQAPTAAPGLTPTRAVLAPTPAPTPAPPPMIVSREINIISEKPPYTTRLAYPYLDDSQEKRFTLFNQQVGQLMEKIQSGFAKDISGWDNQDPNSMGSFNGSSYAITHGNSGIVSVLFTVGFYMAGAAHPNSYFIALNLDLEHQKVLNLADLMLPGANYLGAISAYSIKELQKIGAQDFETGAAPLEENYKAWNITPDGLQISFDPYQVAPYAMGPQVVTIPYSALQGVIDPQGPLAKLLK